jgi:hypothetical protein
MRRRSVTARRVAASAAASATGPESSDLSVRWAPRSIGFGSLNNPTLSISDPLAVETGTMARRPRHRGERAGGGVGGHDGYVDDEYQAVVTWR